MIFNVYFVDYFWCLNDILDIFEQEKIKRIIYFLKFFAPQSTLSLIY